MFTLVWADVAAVQAELVQPADEHEWKLNLGLNIKLLVRVLLGESLLLQWCKGANTKIIVWALFLLCVLGLFWQGNFYGDEILEVLQERTPKVLMVSVSGPHDLSVPAGPHGLSCASLQALALCATACRTRQRWMGQVQCYVRVLYVVLLLVFIFTKACSKPSLSEILLSHPNRLHENTCDLTTVSRLWLLLSFGPDFIKFSLIQIWIWMPLSSHSTSVHLLSWKLEFNSSLSVDLIIFLCLLLIIRFDPAKTKKRL